RRDLHSHSLRSTPKKEPPKFGGSGILSWCGKTRAGIFIEIGESLLALRLLEHSVQALVGRIAAGLRRLRRLQRLIGGALRAGGGLLSLSRCALGCFRRALRGFGRRTNGIDLLSQTCATGRKRNAADDCCYSQSGLEFARHRRFP